MGSCGVVCRVLWGGLHCLHMVNDQLVMCRQSRGEPPAHVNKGTFLPVRFWLADTLCLAVEVVCVHVLYLLPLHPTLAVIIRGCGAVVGITSCMLCLGNPVAVHIMLKLHAEVSRILCILVRPHIVRPGAACHSYETSMPGQSSPHLHARVGTCLALCPHER